MGELLKEFGSIGEVSRACAFAALKMHFLVSQGRAFIGHINALS